MDHDGGDYGAERGPGDPVVRPRRTAGGPAVDARPERVPDHGHGHLLTGLVGCALILAGSLVIIAGVWSV